MIVLLFDPKAYPAGHQARSYALLSPLARVSRSRCPPAHLSTGTQTHGHPVMVPAEGLRRRHGGLDAGGAGQVQVGGGGGAEGGGKRTEGRDGVCVPDLCGGWTDYSLSSGRVLTAQCVISTFHTSQTLFREPGAVEIFFSAHGVPKSYVEEAGDPYKVRRGPCDLTPTHVTTHVAYRLTHVHPMCLTPPRRRWRSVLR